MTEARYRARPLRWDSIAEIAMAQREMLGVRDKEMLPVTYLVECVLAQRLEMFEFLVGSREDMKSAYGFTHPDGDFIMIREDVYAASYQGNGRARFTVAHEWGHWALHVGQPLARAPEGLEVPAYECPERQAHQFAAEVLMPRHLIKGDSNPQSLVNRFGVSFEAASRRVKYLTSRGLLDT
ncbi:hypothetical protein BA190_23995 [Labrys sp. WJW]|uniref:ImmA/IrrE family metallo-endopeptidase n=1 Tax=Labrys sp. WJW TaxID=1737983 RepID=UPI00082BFCCB|nr:ImmA/IrrE family metallo-endopeptidase [Labrys sp. WJW]OCC02390.1 hypothetical protein BA190_23995 [Labrys sp. WJW]